MTCSPRNIEPRDAQANVFSLRCDLTNGEDVACLLNDFTERFGRLDALVNCVGTSDRGLIENLSAERLEQLLRQNRCLTALLCRQASIPLLEKSGRNHREYWIVGCESRRSLHRWLRDRQTCVGGNDPAAAIGIEARAGIHVALVSPGPIRRDDAGQRYNKSLDEGLPSQASAPGGGTRLQGLTPERVADAVVRCIESRKPDIVLPGYLRLLIATVTHSRVSVTGCY